MIEETVPDDEVYILEVGNSFEGGYTPDTAHTTFESLEARKREIRESDQDVVFKHQVEGSPIPLHNDYEVDDGDE